MPSDSTTASSNPSASLVGLPSELLQAIFEVGDDGVPLQNSNGDLIIGSHVVSRVGLVNHRFYDIYKDLVTKRPVPRVLTCTLTDRETGRLDSGTVLHFFGRLDSKLPGEAPPEWMREYDPQAYWAGMKRKESMVLPSASDVQPSTLQNVSQFFVHVGKRLLVSANPPRSATFKDRLTSVPPEVFDAAMATNPPIPVTAVYMRSTRLSSLADVASEIAEAKDRRRPQTSMGVHMIGQDLAACRDLYCGHTSLSNTPITRPVIHVMSMSPQTPELESAFASDAPTKQDRQLIKADLSIQVKELYERIDAAHGRQPSQPVYLHYYPRVTRIVQVSKGQLTSKKYVAPSWTRKMYAAPSAVVDDMDEVFEAQLRDKLGRKDYIKLCRGGSVTDESEAMIVDRRCWAKPDSHNPSMARG